MFPVRTRHMTPEASSTRDSTPVACLAVRSDELGGSSASGPEAIYQIKMLHCGDPRDFLNEDNLAPFGAY